MIWFTAPSIFEPANLLRDIDADVLFERQSMTISAQRGTLNGTHISETVARIPDLGQGNALLRSRQFAQQVLEAGQQRLATAASVCPVVREG